MQSKELAKQALSLDAFLAALSYQEIVAMSKTSKEMKEAIDLHFTNPYYLLQRLSAWFEQIHSYKKDVTWNSKENRDLVAFIARFCHPETLCYKKMKFLANQTDKSDYHTYAFICYALITDNVSQLDSGKFSATLRFLESNPWLGNILPALTANIFVMHFQRYVYKEVFKRYDFKSNYKCVHFLNYSGVDFSKIHELLGEIQFSNIHKNESFPLEDINFSYKNCMGIQIKNRKVISCNFMYANFSKAVLLIEGKNCNFLGANFKDAIFITMDDCKTKEAFVKRLDALHVLLASSKGINNIKSAIITNIGNTLNLVSHEDLKEALYSELRRHSINQHRNNFVRVINFIPSLIKGTNFILTESEREIARVKNAKSIVPSEMMSLGKMSIFGEKSNMVIKTDMGSNILPIELFKGILSHMDERSLLSFKSSSSFFNRHPSVQEAVVQCSKLQIYTNKKTIWTLTSEGRLFYDSNVKTIECEFNLKNDDRIREILFDEPYMYVVTKDNKLYFSWLLLHDADTNFLEIALNLQKDETIEVAVTGQKLLVISTSFNRFIVLRAGLSSDKTSALKLSKDEYVKQVVITLNNHILVLTTKDRIVEYRDSQIEKTDNTLSLFSQYQLVAGNREIDVAIAVNFNNQIILRYTNYSDSGNNTLELYDIPFTQDEMVKELHMMLDRAIVLTSKNRIFICNLKDFIKNFQELIIPSGDMKVGECVAHIRSAFDQMILVTNFGRVLKERNHVVEDSMFNTHISGESGFLRYYESEYCLNYKK